MMDIEKRGIVTIGVLCH